MRVRLAIGIALGLLALPLVSCAQSETPSATVDSAPSAEQLVAALTDVDVTAAPSGPNVGLLMTVEDFQGILGRDDVTLAPAL